MSRPLTVEQAMRQLPTPYARAVAEARQVSRRIDARTVRLIEEALERATEKALLFYRRAYATGALDIAAAMALRTRALGVLRAELEEDLASAIESGVELATRDIQDVWQNAMRQYGAGLADAAAAVGVSTGAAATAAAVGGLSLPALPQIGARQILGRPGLLKTTRQTLPGYVGNAVQDIDSIITEAIADRIGPDKLAKALRPYIKEAAQFDTAFGAKAFDRIRDMRGRLPDAVKDAGRKIRYNAERIAFTELQQGRANAEVQAWLRDPYVKAVRWQRSPNRSRLSQACGCDVLAENDFHKLGAGVYPVSAVPALPHPWCRCERFPITVDEPVDLRTRAQGVPAPSAERAFVRDNVLGQLHPGGRKIDTTPASAMAARKEAQRAMDIAAAATGQEIPPERLRWAWGKKVP